MSLIVNGAEIVSTITFPNTVTAVQDLAFTHRFMRSVVLNEGLLQLGEDSDEYSRAPNGCFRNNQIKRVTIPSTLLLLGQNTFYGCHRLKYVTFRERSRLEKIAKNCFTSSSIEEIALPGTLREMSDNAFNHCSDLGVVWVEDGCAVDVREHVDYSVAVMSKQNRK